tara:strand:- start:247 stop:369 length:123 start_codon:yes stop_codon:yes gene_type:complete
VEQEIILFIYCEKRLPEGGRFFAFDNLMQTKMKQKIRIFY